MAVSQSRGPPAELLRQVFISHTAADEQGRIFAASILAPALERAGLKPYLDCSDLKPGCEFQEELVQAAATSAVFVVVITKQYPQRLWCLKELDLALHGHPSFPRQTAPTIIPVRIDARETWQQLSQQQLQQDIERRMATPPAVGDPCQQQELQDLHQHAQRLLNNIAALSRLQDVRRLHQSEQQQQQEGGAASSSRRQSGPKDEERQLAEAVAAAAKDKLPALAYTPDGLVGTYEQRACLLYKLAVDAPDYKVLWLYGPGGCWSLVWCGGHCATTQVCGTF